MKILLSAFLIFSFFAGCTTTKYVYIPATCPKIQVLKPVDRIKGEVVDGCLCNDGLLDVLNGAAMLRKSEAYYIEQVGKYNKEFATPKESIDK